MSVCPADGDPGSRRRRPAAGPVRASGRVGPEARRNGPVATENGSAVRRTDLLLTSIETHPRGDTRGGLPILGRPIGRNHRVDKSVSVRRRRRPAFGVVAQSCEAVLSPRVRSPLTARTWRRRPGRALAWCAPRRGGVRAPRPPEVRRNTAGTGPAVSIPYGVYAVRRQIRGGADRANASLRDRSASSVENEGTRRAVGWNRPTRTTRRPGSPRSRRTAAPGLCRGPTGRWTSSARWCPRRPRRAPCVGRRPR